MKQSSSRVHWCTTGALLRLGLHLRNHAMGGLWRVGGRNYALLVSSSAVAACKICNLARSHLGVLLLRFQLDFEHHHF